MQILPDSLSNEEYAVAIKKDNNELKDQVDKVITEMKKDGRYQKLVKKYFNEVSEK